MTEKTVLFHSAGIVRNKKGYLFLGTSGNGKSTICDLSRDDKVVHDDNIHVAKINNGFYMRDSNSKYFFKIHRIFFIFKGRRNVIKDIPFKKALKFIMNETIAKEYKFSVLKKKTKEMKYFFNFAIDILQAAFYHKIYFKKSGGLWKAIDRLEA